MPLSRRRFLKTAAGASALTFAPSQMPAAPAAEKPNVILIVADDLGYECLGCNGGTDYATPRLDALARTGLRFEHCYSQPICTPTRVQIMTGRYNHRNYTGFGEMDPGEITFGNVMQRAGYATFIAGKWQLGGGYRKPYRFGFDEYCLWHIQGREQRYWQPRIVENEKLREDVAGRYGPDVFCESILDFIERKKEEPFFVYYPMALTHSPFCPTPDTPGAKSEDRKGNEFFGGMVSYMDKIVGRITDKLDALGLRENTILLFTSDNGTHRNISSNTLRGPVQGGKGATTDAGTHVPLIVSWPGTAPKGKVCGDLIDFSDFLPTFAEAAGGVLPRDRAIDGRSFLPQLEGKKGTPREWVFSHYWGERGRTKEGAVEFTRDKRWKLYSSGDLYDLTADPLERSPLQIPTGEAADAKQRLRAALDSVTRPTN